MKNYEITKTTANALQLAVENNEIEIKESILECIKEFEKSYIGTPRTDHFCIEFNTLTERIGSVESSTSTSINIEGNYITINYGKVNSYALIDYFDDEETLTEMFPDIELIEDMTFCEKVEAIGEEKVEAIAKEWIDDVYDCSPDVDRAFAELIDIVEHIGDYFTIIEEEE